MQFMEGERIEIITKSSNYLGIVIPSSEKNVILIKLDNGYNVGFSMSDVKIKKIAAPESLEKIPKMKLKKSGHPKISLITTGGTITSRVDYKTGAVKSLIEPEQLLANIPEIADICEIKLVNPFSVMSEDMTQKEWSEIIEAVQKELNSDSVGVILTHGTDTLHFTSAAMSFAFPKPSKPIALVGGQKSSDRGSFDGAQNLICAIHYCLSDIAEVAVVMHGETDDSFCLATKGTKVRKMHSSRRDAFRPINAKPVAKIWPDGKIEFVEKFNKRTNEKTNTSSVFSNKVALVKFVPGMNSEIIDCLVKNGYRGIVLEGTGLGHVSVLTLDKKNSWLDSIKNAIKSGVLVCMTTQCIYGRVDPFVYSGGRMLESEGVVYLDDMLPETAYVKLCFALGQFKSLEKAKKFMIENISGEIATEQLPGSFLY